MKTRRLDAHAAKRSRAKKRIQQLEPLEPRFVLAGAPLLIDINPLGDSTPQDFVRVADQAFFVADDGSNGRELWATDGSDAGTRLVSDIFPGSDSSNPSDLTEFNGSLFFVADNGIDGRELWSSDGTDSGTVMVKDINAGEGYQAPSGYGPLNSSPQGLTVSGGRLFFRAEEANSGVELWSSDGTEVGTEIVKNIAVGASGDVPSAPSNPEDLVAVGETLFFTADDGANGRELWKSDGTDSGTVIVADLFPGESINYVDGVPNGTLPNSSNPDHLTAVDGNLFFSAENDSVGREVWVSDGTESGTRIVRDIFVGTDSALLVGDQLIEQNGTLLFSATDGSSGAELWRSDGTESGTFQVKDINPGIGDSIDGPLVNANGVVYFAADDQTNGTELWKTDGTESGTVLVSDIEPGLNGSYPYDMAAVEGSIFFVAFTDAEGVELWESDGTNLGTEIVADLLPGAGNSFPEDLFNFNGTVLFSADDESNGRELWAVDSEVQTASIAARLTIFVDEQPVEIPEGIGIDAAGDAVSQITTGSNGTLLINPIADESLGTITLGDFFETWRTNAGAVGNNPDAIFSDDQLLGSPTSFDSTIQMFVNGSVSTELASQVIQDSDEIILTIGENPVVSLNTNFGSLVFELFEEDTPITVDNFLTYANDGRYLDSFFHRSVPGFVIQGGGFVTTSPTFSDVSQFSPLQTDPTIQNEPLRSNVRGTVAMAKLGGDPNSATSQFFVNLSDDNTFLDLPENNSFTVFAQVLDMTSSDNIAALPVNRDNGSPFGELPLSADNRVVVVQSIEGQGSITGSYFVDANGDGIRDSDEQGIPLPNVYLDLNNNSIADQDEPRVTPNSDGDFRFQVLPGDYTVRVEQLEGTELTLPVGADSYDVSVEIGREVANIDFAETALLAPTGVDLLAASDTGLFDDDDLTNRNNTNDSSTLQFLVTGVTDGTEVRVYADANLIGTGIANGTEAIVTTDGSSTIADGAVLITASQAFTDGETSRSDPLVITVDSVPPADITSDAPEFAEVDVLLSVDVQSSQEGQQVSYSLVNAPAGMTIAADSGVLEWTPTSAQAVPQEFEIVIQDRAGNQATQSVDLTVLASLPALPDTYSVSEDQTLNVNNLDGLLANDGNSDSRPLSAAVIDSATFGVLSLNQDGSFDYTPNLDFFGVDSFTYQVTATDNNELSNVARVTITVDPVNDPTTVVADNYSTDEDTPLVVDAAAGVLANDSDPDSQSLIAQPLDSPTNGLLDFDGDGSFQYTPNLDFFGTDSFTYSVLEGGVQSEVTQVTITVLELNDAPIGNTDSYSSGEDQTLTVDVAEGLLANDLDPDSTLTATIASQAVSGTVTVNSDGSFAYIPDSNFFGSDSFTYTVSDGLETSDQVQVLLTIESQPDPPTAVDDAVNAANDGTIQAIDVLSNDSSDPDELGQALSLSAITQGEEGGAVTIEGDVINYEAPTGFLGTDRFTYTITDSDGLTSTATVEVEVLDTGTSSISGFVFLDADDDGEQDSNESGIPGSFITLSGTTVFGEPFNASTITDNDGSYLFTNLSAGTYQVTQQQPQALNDGQERTGNDDATVNEDQFADITLTGGQDLTSNNFAEASLRPEFISIQWFFALSTPESVLRDTLATGEQLAGNLELAATIRGDQTDVPTDTNDAPIVLDDQYSLDINEVLTVDVTDGVLVNDSDPDGDELTATLEDAPDNGTIQLNADGSFTYTPNDGFVGTDQFDYAATDLFDVSTSGTVTITVVDDPNVFTIPENSERDTLVGSLTASSSPVVFEFENLDAVPEVKLLPDDHFDDGRAQPDVVATAPIVLVEYLSFQCSVCARFHPIIEDLQDEFGDDLLVVRRHLPLEGVFPNAISAARASEAANRQGAFDDMGDLLFERQTEWSPLSVSEAEFTFEDYAVELGLDLNQFRNDVADPGIAERVQRDADIAAQIGANATPTFFMNGVEISTPADLNAFEVVVQDELNTIDDPFLLDRLTGELFVRDSAALDFETNPNFALTVNATDSNGTTTPIEVDIRLTDVNESVPIAVGDSYSVDEDDVLTVDVASGVLANDTDSGDETLTAQIVSSTTNGLLDLNSDGSFTYTPSVGFNGPDTFTYVASDGENTSSETVVSINVVSVNNEPIALDDQYTVAAGSGLVVDVASGVLANDTDSDGDDLTAETVVGTTSGILILNADGSFNYTPTAGFVGQDSFTYQANDGALSSEVATVNITVTESDSNTAPVAVSDQFSVDQDTESVIVASGVLANDTDADGDTLVARLFQAPTNGTLVLEQSGAFTYTPTAGFTGDDFFIYQADDGQTFSNVATVTITVVPANNIPVAANDSYSVDQDETLNIDATNGVLANDTDGDSDPLTVQLESGATNGTVTLQADGSFEYIPNSGFFGGDSFSYVARDGFDSSNTAQVSITVNELVSEAITLNAIADATLYEDATGSLANGSGEHLFVGRTDQGSDAIRRALLRFDVAGQVPSDATITNAELRLNMSRTIVGPVPVDVFAVSTAWDEGPSDAIGQEGRGIDSEPGDVTWIHSSHDDQFWTNPGGDFNATASATVSVDGSGTYTWSSASLIQDVQAWLDDDSTNFGWILIADESVQSAKRFDSDENSGSDNRPQLLIDYTVPGTQVVAQSLASPDSGAQDDLQARDMLFSETDDWGVF